MGYHMNAHQQGCSASVHKRVVSQWCVPLVMKEACGHAQTTDVHILTGAHIIMAMGLIALHDIVWKRLTKCGHGRLAP